jgi:hypothetical protein
MKKYIYTLLVLFIVPFLGTAQDSDEVQQDTIVKTKEKLERSAFESSYIIDNQTNVVLSKNAMEIMLQHRFATVQNGWEDLAGIYGPNANIRIGGGYGVHERVTLGFGITKNKMLLDFNAKVAILRQTRSEKMPLSLSYYGNFAYDARQQENTNFSYSQDRFSFFHQLIVVRRISPEFSVQGSLSFSHYNTVEVDMRNDMVAFSLGGRYKITPNTAILVDYSQPITEMQNYYGTTDPDTGDVNYENNNPYPGISLGFEFGTSGHAFQLFISNYAGIVPQENYMYNKNDFFNGDILIGFNITRIYNF